MEADGENIRMAVNYGEDRKSISALCEYDLWRIWKQATLEVISKCSTKGVKITEGDENIQYSCRHTLWLTDQYLSMILSSN